MSNKTKRIMTMILAILLVLAMLAGVVLPALADDSLDDLEWEKDQLEQEAEDAEAIANATEEEIAAAQEKLDKVNGEIETINKNLPSAGQFHRTRPHGGAVPGIIAGLRRVRPADQCGLLLQRLWGALL